MTSPAPNLPYLTGLRGVAAYSVLIGHALNGAFQDYTAPPLSDFAVRIAETGITLFFVLSGFVIHYNYSELFRRERFSTAAWSFLVARFARLYPLYALAGFIALAALPPPHFIGQPWALVASVTMTQSWFNMQYALFNPLWTISTEWYFYFAFLGLVYVGFFVTRPALTLICFIVTGFAIWIAVLVFKGQIAAAISPLLTQPEGIGTTIGNWLVYFNPYLRVLEFIAGGLASITYLRWRDDPLHVRVRLLAPVALACYAAVLFLPVESLWPFSALLSNFLLVPVFAFAMIYIGTADGIARRFLSSRPLLFAGEISYSIYVWHFWIFPALQNAFRAKDDTPFGLWDSAIKVVLVVILATFIAYGSYHLLEVPARRWVRARLAPNIVSR